MATRRDAAKPAGSRWNPRQAKAIIKRRPWVSTVVVLASAVVVVGLAVHVRRSLSATPPPAPVRTATPAVPLRTGPPAFPLKVGPTGRYLVDGITARS